MKRKNALTIAIFITLATSLFIIYYQTGSSDDALEQEYDLNYSQVQDLESNITSGYTHILPDGNGVIGIFLIIYNQGCNL
jgi:hypothetical protein